MNYPIELPGETRRHGALPLSDFGDPYPEQLMRDGWDMPGVTSRRRFSPVTQLTSMVLMIFAIAGASMWWATRMDGLSASDAGAEMVGASSASQPPAATPTPTSSYVSAEPAPAIRSIDRAAAPATPAPARAEETPARLEATVAPARERSTRSSTATLHPRRPERAMHARTLPRKASQGTASFGIAVGTFMDEGRAIAERTRLEASTHLSAIIESTPEGGTLSYRVIVGHYSTRQQAEDAGTWLMRSVQLRESVVAPLPSGY
jgi:hypothetical protein